jgi:putative membrane protein
MLKSVKQIYGDRLGALDGEIGHVKDFYFSDVDWVVRYLVADTVMNTSNIVPNSAGSKSRSPLLSVSALLVASALLTAIGDSRAADKSSAPTDAEIAMIVVVADTVDVNYGKLAVKTTRNPEVKEFAETMVRDHTAVNDKAIALAKKLGVTSKPSDTSKSLASDGKQELANLKSLHGAEFDKAYVENEVSYHEAVIHLLDTTLIPNAKNAELKALLESGRPIFAAHLEHAKKLRASLAK